MNSMTIRKGAHQVHNARWLRDLGFTRTAALYLRRCGWSLEGALYILTGKSL